MNTRIIRRGQTCPRCGEPSMNVTEWEYVTDSACTACGYEASAPAELADGRIGGTMKNLKTLCPRCTQYTLTFRGEGQCAQCTECFYTERATCPAALAVALAERHAKASHAADDIHAEAFRWWHAHATRLNATPSRVLCPWCGEPTLVLEGSIAYCERADCMFRLRMSDRAILFGELAGLHEAHATHGHTHHERGKHEAEARYLRLVAKEERRATLQEGEN